MGALGARRMGMKPVDRTERRAVVGDNDRLASGSPPYLLADAAE